VLVSDNPTLALDAVGPSTPTVENRQLGDARIKENAPEARAAVGEGSQHRVLGSSDGVEALADQDLDVCISFRDRTENLPAIRVRFDVADPHLQMPLAILTAANERRIQGHGDGRRRHFCPGFGITPERCADLQGMPAHSLRILPGVNRKHLPQHVSGHPVWHQGRKVSCSRSNSGVDRQCDGQPVPVSIAPHPVQRKRGSRTVTWPQCVATAWLR
jgi:hypothetical protein